MSEHIIYAKFNDEAIRVYQAYNDAIAEEAAKLGKFGNLFKRDRMTWIKPSFLWMMYRAGWAEKEDQTRILAIDMNRTGFDFICKSAVVSSYTESDYASKKEWERAVKFSQVRCQWDPERDIYGNPLTQRTIQLGIRGDMVRRFVDEWIMKITDITSEVKNIKLAIENKTFTDEMLPLEKKYDMIRSTEE